jgi:chemotaxis protein methyltransferase CheR
MSCSETDYAYLRKVVLEESANLIDPTRNGLFEARLMPIARTVGAENVEGLVELLRVDPTTHLHRAVAEAMTINETSFFRDVRPFEMLRSVAIPELMRQKQAERTLRVWCAACATGQEAYSVAMLLLEHFPELQDWDVKIIGTDLSQIVLEYARRGRYRRNEVNRGLPAKMLVKYFERRAEEWEVSTQVRALCEFECANLCAPLPPLPVFDLVLLRNVLLYFPEQDRSCVFADVHGRMNPRGFLLLGNSEQAEDSTDLFEMEFASDSYFYRPLGMY